MNQNSLKGNQLELKTAKINFIIKFDRLKTIKQTFKKARNDNTKTK